MLQIVVASKDRSMKRPHVATCEIYINVVRAAFRKLIIEMLVKLLVSNYNRIFSNCVIEIHFVKCQGFLSNFSSLHGGRVLKIYAQASGYVVTLKCALTVRQPCLNLVSVFYKIA